MFVLINIVTQWLKVVITEQEEVGIAKQRPVSIPGIATQWSVNDNDVVFSMWSVLRLYNKDQWDKPLSYSQKLAARQSSASRDGSKKSYEPLPRHD
jgi:hypothetical protein